jgi:hypothetical protein
MIVASNFAEIGAPSKTQTKTAPRCVEPMKLKEADP